MTIQDKIKLVCDKYVISIGELRGVLELNGLGITEGAVRKWRNGEHSPSNLTIKNMLTDILDRLLEEDNE